MLARDHPLGIRQREFRICDFGLSEFCEPWVKPLDPTSSLRGSARFKQVFRLFSELLQARPSRQLLCIHTNVLPLLCLESALIRLKECSFFRFQLEGGHGPFRGLVAPLRARPKLGLAEDFRQSDFSYSHHCEW